MAIEAAFHKLSDPNDFPSIEEEGFRPSVPAENQWLGEGVYFFLDPNGLRWAKGWPFNASFSSRTGSAEGIVQTTVDTEKALDLRDDEVRALTWKVVEKLKARLMRAGHDVFDGLAFALIFKAKLLGGVVNYEPTAIIANFDKTWTRYRKDGSRVFLDLEEAPVYKNSAQIQACVLDRGIIGKLSLCKT